MNYEFPPKPPLIPRHMWHGAGLRSGLVTVLSVGFNVWVVVHYAGGASAGFLLVNWMLAAATLFFAYQYVELIVEALRHQQALRRLWAEHRAIHDDLVAEIERDRQRRQG